MLHRRSVIAGAIALAVSVGAACAQDYKAQYPGTGVRHGPGRERLRRRSIAATPLVNYLSKELGVKVTLRIANDYAAVIEGQRAGNIHIAMYGPASYRARCHDRCADRAVRDRGERRRHQGLLLRLLCEGGLARTRGSQDLKGKNLCLVDPNSTSGNNVPRFAMNKMGIEPEKFFGKVVYAGSHENAVIGAAAGHRATSAFNWWNDEKESNLLRMARKGMAKVEDFRIIFKSELIVNSPMAYLSTSAAEPQGRDQDGRARDRHPGPGGVRQDL